MGGDRRLFRIHLHMRHLALLVQLALTTHRLFGRNLHVLKSQ